MNGLALFAGVGGLELGLKLILPDLKTVCHVEGEVFNAELIKRKIEAGKIEPGFIFSDVKSFGQVAHVFNKKVDFISGGFPCQPFSNAGKRKGTNDERWVWSSIIEIIGETKPNFLFLENVSNLLNDVRAFDEICFSLSEIGFNIEWSTLRASDVGANHQRNRLFIFAYKKEALYKLKPQIPNSNGQRRNKKLKEIWGGKFNAIGGGDDANSNGQRCDKLDNASKSAKTERQLDKGYNKTGKYGNLPHSGGFRPRKNANGFTPSETMFDTFPGYDSPDWWKNEPRVRRVVDGVAFGSYRIRACGNGVVPLQAGVAYYHLIQRAKQINGVA